MAFNLWQISVVFMACLAVVPLQAGSVSRQSAETFARKIALIERQGSAEPRSAPRRTPLTQDEVNSWFVYRGAQLLPEGLLQPELLILGSGRVTGQATLDLEAVGKRRGSGGTLDPWSLLGGRVPVKVTGVLHTENGHGRFELQEAELAGILVPAVVLQELLSSYSRSPEQPQGLRLDGIFALPANIRQIEVGQGQAVVVQ